MRGRERLSVSSRATQEARKEARQEALLECEANVSTSYQDEGQHSQETFNYYEPADITEAHDDDNDDDIVGKINEF